MTVFQRGRFLNTTNNNIQEKNAGSTNMLDGMWETPVNNKAKLMSKNNYGIYCGGWTTPFHEVSTLNWTSQASLHDAKPTLSSCPTSMHACEFLSKCSENVVVVIFKSWHMELKHVSCHQVSHNLIDAASFALRKGALRLNRFLSCKWRRLMTDLNH